MATLTAKIRTALEADSALTTLVAGGIYDASELPREGLTLSNAVKLGDGIRLATAIVLRWRASGMYQNQMLSAERRLLEVWMYTDSDYSILEQVKARVKVLLDQQYWLTDDFVLANSLWSGDMGEFRAAELNNAAADRAAFYFVLARQSTPA